MILSLNSAVPDLLSVITIDFTSPSVGDVAKVHGICLMSDKLPSAELCGFSDFLSFSELAAYLRRMADSLDKIEQKNA